jgi:NADH dehydrogenase
MTKKIVIVGGGFGGIRCALDLAKKSPKDAKIILISDKSHFEYYPTLYKVIIGKSPIEVCIPLDEIFKGKNIEIIKDRISSVDTAGRMLTGESGSKYGFDYVVLALGSETAYFNVPGLPELSFSFKSINEALKLKRHLHELFNADQDIAREEAISNLHLLVVGGGATGTELAGDLFHYMRRLAKDHKIDPNMVTVDLIESAPRLLQALPEEVSYKVFRRLHGRGVNIFLNRTVMKEDIEQVFLKDMTLKSKTVIWTAGVKTNQLYGAIKDFALDKKGRVIVDEMLQPKGMKNIFILGDGASTPYAGLAQTAIYDGSFIASNIADSIAGRKMKAYQPKKIAFAIPIGPMWAVFSMGRIRLYGAAAWILRQLIDLNFFTSILPFRKALDIFFGGKKVCESCATCLKSEAEK